MVSVGKSDVIQWLIEELQARRIVGLHRYGEPLNPENKRDNLRDALEETLDLAAYLRNEIAKRGALEAEKERLRAITEAHMEGGRWVCVVEVARLQAEIERLRALIDKHDDECRECPVIGT